MDKKKAPNKPPDKNFIKQVLDNLKIGYTDGKNPIGRAMTGHGFMPSKNAALNFGALMNMPYDPEMRIRPKDPQQQLRANNARIGQIERIHNVYIKPRVKLAD
jgi:hypothetical protein